MTTVSQLLARKGQQDFLRGSRRHRLYRHPLMADENVGSVLVMEGDKVEMSASSQNGSMRETSR